MHAKKNNIPIYIIVIGENVPTYNLSQLSNHTGGRLFIIDEDKINSISPLLKTIVNAQHNHYRINLATNTPQLTPAIEINLDLQKNPTTTLKDKINAPLYLEKMFSEYQALAYYDLHNSDISDLFQPSIRNLIEVLKANPTLIVELIGNANSGEGNEDQCKQLGLRRARLVRQTMIDNGVHPEQIRASSEGSSRPLYLFPRFNWHHKYNSRLEIRWLLPEDYPYEIVTDNYISESEANKNVEF